MDGQATTDWMSDRDIKNYAEFKAVMIKERLGEN